MRVVQLELEALSYPRRVLEDLDEVRRSAINLSEGRRNVQNCGRPSKQIKEILGQRVRCVFGRSPAKIVDRDVEMRGHLYELVFVRRGSALPCDKSICLHADLPGEPALAHRRRLFEASADSSLDGRLGHVIAGTKRNGKGAVVSPYVPRISKAYVGTNGDSFVATDASSEETLRGVKRARQTLGCPR